MSPELFQSGELADFAALHAACFPDGWNAQALAALLATPGTFLFFQKADGFILARAAGGEAEILTLAVMPQARGAGIGRALVRAAAAHAHGLGAQTLFLEVASDNQPALALYAGLGLRAAGLRKAYYGTQDAHLLKAALPLPNPGDFA